MDTTDDAKDAWYRRLFEVAVMVGSAELVEVLLGAGVNNLAFQNCLGQTLVYIASRRGHFKVLRQLVEAGSDIHIPDYEGRTPIYASVLDGDIEQARFLLSQGANIFQSDKDGLTPLHVACIEGHAELATLFLDNGLEPDIGTSGGSGLTLLHLASQYGHLGIAELLVSRGASIAAQDNEGATALVAAAAYGSLDVVEFLLEQGADTEIKTNEGCTALLLAALAGDVEVFQILLDYGACTDIVTTNGETVLFAAINSGHSGLIANLLSRGSDPNFPEQVDGGTPLCLAAYQCHLDVVELLLRYGARLSDKNSEGRIPLHLVVENDDIDVIEFLVSKSVGLLEQKDAEGCTPLHIAASNDYLEAAEILLDKGADVDAKDINTNTPLMLACINCHLDMVALLLKNNADLHAADCDGRTPLTESASEGHSDILRLLLKEGAETNSSSTVTKVTALNGACYAGQLNTVKILLEHGANVNARDGEGATPLYVAAFMGRLDIVELLVDYHADIELANKDDWTPLHCACNYGHLAVVAHLLNNGANANSLTNRLDTPLLLASYYGHLDIVKILLYKGAVMPLSNCLGEHKRHRTTALINASAGHAEMVEVLLEAGFDINEPNDKGLTPIDAATENGHTEVVVILLQHGSHTGHNEAGFTSLHLASEMGFVDIAKTLLANGAEVDAVTANGSSCFYIACSQGKIDVARVLLDAGADVCKSNNDGTQPVHVAAYQGHVEALELLLTEGVDIHVQDNSGTAPLSMASAGARVEAARLLLRNGADPNQPNRIGSRAIHHACFKGCVEVIKLLLESGSNLSVANEDGLTPVFIAGYRSGYVDLTRLLVEKLADPSIAERDGAAALKDASVFDAYIESAKAIQGSRQTYNRAEEEEKFLAMVRTSVGEQAQEGNGSVSVDVGVRPTETATTLMMNDQTEGGVNERVSDDETSNGSRDEIVSLNPGASESAMTPKHESLCFPCRRIFSGTMPPLPVDPKLQIDKLAGNKTANRAAGETPSSQHPGPSSTRPRKLFMHHPSSHSLFEASQSGCYVCKRIWGRFEPQLRQILLNADEYTVKEPFHAFSYFTLMIQPSSQCWAFLPLFESDFERRLGLSTRDWPQFVFIPLKDAAAGCNPINPVSLNTGSTESLSFAENMFQGCIKTHKQCSMKPEEGAWLPTRLVRIGNVSDGEKTRLVLSQDIPSEGATYCTLSHCWGKTKVSSLLKANLDAFRLEMDETQLPKSFTESFVVAKRLGIKYIWIDSLCIIQDDAEDWLSQASQMHHVYMNSVCNICATSAADSTQGLFRVREPDVFQPCDVEIPWLDTGGQFRIFDANTWDGEVTQSPLNLRAWVIQEHLLAPRQLHFGSTQVLWQCLHPCTCEEYPDGLPKRVALHSMQHNGAAGI